MKKYTNTIIAILGVVVLYFIAIKPFIDKKQAQKQAQIESTVILEKTKKIIQLAAVEGNFTELMTYKQADYDFPGFRKKAIIQVKGRALIGYKLDNIEIKTDAKEKKVIINNFPKAEVLALETDLNYFDLDEGLFNEFSTSDHNLMQAKAKALIANKIPQSGLLEKAEQQKKDMLDMLLFAVAGKDWKVYVNGTEMKPNIVKNKKD